MEMEVETEANAVAVVAEVAHEAEGRMVVSSAAACVAADTEA